MDNDEDIEETTPHGAPEGSRVRSYILSPRDIDRVEVCPASGVFVQREKKAPSFAQFYGIYMHRFVEYAHKRGRDYALNYIASASRTSRKCYAVCEALDLASIPTGRDELAWAYDTSSQECLYGEPEDPEDILPSTHIRGRADIVVASGAPNTPYFKVLEVWDMKTGDSRVDPRTSGQIRTTVAAMWDGISSVVGGIADIMSDGRVVKRTHTFTPDEILAERHRLRRIHLSIIEARHEYRHEHITPMYQASVHCRWCNHKSVCDAAIAYEKGVKVVAKEAKDAAKAAKAAAKVSAKAR